MRKRTGLWNSTVMIAPRRKDSRHGLIGLNNSRGVWFSLGKLGLVGCSVVLPMLFGAMIGTLLDNRYTGNHFWALALLLVGFLIGCLNAWHWMAREVKEIRKEQDENDE